jgi:signal transduction histidine kinase
MDLSRTVEALREEIARRALAEEQLRTANAILETRKAQLQRLASELTLAEQREQHRLAQILHDELQQLLVAAKFRLAFMQQTRSDTLRRTATDVVGLIDQSIETSSSLTAQLSPPALYEGGLISALQWLTRWMGEKHHLEVALTVDGNIRFTAREDMTVLLFRAVRELLFNVVKHSAVREARVEISGLDSQIRVIVADSGIGFDPSRLPATRGVGGGFGLLSVRERLDILGGRMEIESAPGRGSRFTLLAPIGEDVPL